MPPESADQADLLRRLLDYDRQVEDLEAEIAAAEAELKDMRKRLTSAVLARAKLSREIRRPRPILGSEKGDI
jgi:predicted  nucleic acid-binding Zn-ribbon protein